LHPRDQEKRPGTAGAFADLFKGPVGIIAVGIGALGLAIQVYDAVTFST